MTKTSKYSEQHRIANNTSSFTLMNIENEALSCLQAFGLIVDKIIFDSCLHRTPTQAKPRKRNGWYIAFMDTGVIQMGDHQSNEQHRFIPKNKTVKPQKYKRVLCENHAKQTRTKQHLAAQQAFQRYESAGSVGNHPYLRAKNIIAHSSIHQENGLLLIPLIDFLQSPPHLRNLQTINAKGTKYFLPGAQVKGLCFPIGFEYWDEQTPLYICEGVATAITLYEQTKQPVLAALTCTNLHKIAQIARSCWPLADIIIAGDDDLRTEQKTGRNPGRMAAIHAAQSIKGQICFPPLTLAQQQQGLSDWNDFFNNRAKETQYD